MKSGNKHIVTKFIFITFRVMGLAPLAIKKFPESNFLSKRIHNDFTGMQFSPSRLACLYNLCLIIGQAGLLFFAIPKLFTDQYPEKSNLNDSVVLVATVIGNSALFMIYLTPIFRQEKFASMLNRLFNMDDTLIRKNDKRARESCPYSVPFQFLINIVTCALVIATRFIWSNRSVLVLSRIQFPTVIAAWYINQYIILIKLIYMRTKSFNCCLLDNLMSPPLDNRFPLCVASDAFFTVMRKIIIFRRLHTNLFEIATEVSELYSLPMLLAITFSSLVIIFNLYYVIILIATIIDMYPILVIAQAIVSVVTVLLPIVMLAAEIKSFNDEMKKTRDIVSKLRVHWYFNRNVDIEVFIKPGQTCDICHMINNPLQQLQRFMFDLTDRNVEFTAYGFFSLDLTLVHSILSMVTTYLIILVQHRMGVAS